MANPAQAVFLSYASEDTDAAQRIAAALRAAGIDVWFDRSELRGGDAWDQRIRQQIRDCTLFMPVISARTQARSEGYFRLEWRLADQRTLLMGRQRAFLVPVAVDATPERDADVPDSFLAVQWMRLPDGAPTPEFVERTQRLLAPAPVPPATTRAPAGAPPAPATDPARAAPPRGRWKLAGALLGVAIAVAALVPWWQHREHARNVLLPAIEAALAKSPHSNARILDMALAVEQIIPKDPALAKLWPQIAAKLTIESEPAGAAVYWKDYGTPGDPWRLAGTTPLKETRVPRDVLRVELRKEGYQTVELVSPRFLIGNDMPRLKLDRAGALPANMVRIPAGKTDLNIVGLDKYGGVEVPEFLADRYEVTNREYKAFIEAGGYADPRYWQVPVMEQGRQIPPATARARFTDRTGRPGPSTWEAGTYPDGEADHPVAGISWYEAAAYAAWAGKQLPTVYQWAQLADTWNSEFLVPFSNFGDKGTTAAGRLGGLSSFGVYDIAGNVREWTRNPSGNPQELYILGGGYTDQTYAFNDAYAQPALDRSPTNGLRCIRELPDQAAPEALARPLPAAYRDYGRERAVDDRTFAQYARQFVYDRAPLDARIDKVVESDDWKMEAVSVNAAYNGERLPIYVYLPRHARAPYPPVVLFPGSSVLFDSRFDANWIEGFRDYSFILKSGRALVIPVYKSTFDRRDSVRSDLANESVGYKDHVIMWVKDYSRTLDYLETRPDMRADRIAYLGSSWGGFMGGIIPAVEKRIHVVVLNVGGMSMESAQPEVDQINFLPRVTQPVLMLNGEFDNYFPVETSQKPLYRLLGTPAADKQMIVYPSGHLVPRVEFIKETLRWLDKYQGPSQPTGP